MTDDSTHTEQLHDLMGEATRGIAVFRPDPTRLRRARRIHRVKNGIGVSTASALAVVTVAAVTSGLAAPGREHSPTASPTTVVSTPGLTHETSTAPVPIPASLKGLPEDAVIAALRSAGFDAASISVITVPNSSTAGTVLDVTDGGTEMSLLGRTADPSTTTLNLVVSVEVPKIQLHTAQFIGLDCDTAVTHLAALGFVNIATAVDTSVPPAANPVVTKLGIADGLFPHDQPITVYCMQRLPK